MAEIQLLPGININNNVIAPIPGLVDTMMDREFNLDLVANTDHENMGADTLSFIIPDVSPITVLDKADAVDNGCEPISYTCDGAVDNELELTKYVREGRQMATCPVNQVSPELARRSLTILTAKWAKARLVDALGTIEASFAAHPVVVGQENILEIIEAMIVELELKGFSREHVTVALGTKAASAARSLGFTADRLTSLEVSENTFDVKSVVDVGNYFKTVDIAVYVKDYVIAGSNCNREPEMYEGTEGFRGRTLISGEMVFGSGVIKVKPEGEEASEAIGLTYTIPVE